MGNREFLNSPVSANAYASYIHAHACARTRARVCVYVLMYIDICTLSEICMCILIALFSKRQIARLACVVHQAEVLSMSAALRHLSQEGEARGCKA